MTPTDLMDEIHRTTVTESQLQAAKDIGTAMFHTWIIRWGQDKNALEPLMAQAAVDGMLHVLIERRIAEAAK